MSCNCRVDDGPSLPRRINGVHLTAPRDTHIVMQVRAGAGAEGSVLPLSWEVRETQRECRWRCVWLEVWGVSVCGGVGVCVCVFLHVCVCTCLYLHKRILSTWLHSIHAPDQLAVNLPPHTHTHTYVCIYTSLPRRVSLCYNSDGRVRAVRWQANMTIVYTYIPELHRPWARYPGSDRLPITHTCMCVYVCVWH